ncbi:hypothetical protein EW145_g7261 [Phellinidium pouzarii]|uniref:Protein kinase domain-containing protein n=1 Tax=Phellinidium pouzarii TaxID=167371 RepID=A0A4V3XAU4_9AGAM|nr:hypothetical protein EW145_g7261 [Phellinidium pouzarii]
MNLEDDRGVPTDILTSQQLQEVLYQTLKNLNNLDLTAQVTFDDSDLRIRGGGYADVYIGTYMHLGRGAIKVAIKRLRFYSKDSLRELAKLVAREIYIWSKLEHPNVLQLLGYIIEKDGLPSLVSEWMENGSVLEYVKGSEECDIMPLVRGIADGLAYLHENDVVHSDIKSSAGKDNVLVSSSGIARICDFGISRAINATQMALGGDTTLIGGPNGSARWIAYELFANSEEYRKPSKESDVWAFGMTVYKELLAKEIPYAQIRVEYQVIVSIICETLPSRPLSFDNWPEERKEIWKLCELCWTLDPTQRITILMAGVVKCLTALRPTVDLNDLSPDLDYLCLSGSTIYNRKISDTARGMEDVEIVLKRYCFYVTRQNSKKTIKVQFANELLIWSKLKHKNVLHLLGHVRLEDGVLYFVSEWMKEGTVRTFVKDDLDADLIHISLGIAEGLNYLHTEEVVYGNIRSENVLISGDRNSLICGFENSHKVNSSNLEINDGENYHKESVRWTAPELFAENQRYMRPSKESDVWAFGMTIYEILADEILYSHFQDADVASHILLGELPSRPGNFESCPPQRRELWNICEGCWIKDPKRRPAMIDIVARLRSLRARADTGEPNEELIGVFADHGSSDPRSSRSSSELNDGDSLGNRLHTTNRDSELKSMSLALVDTL